MINSVLTMIGSQTSIAYIIHHKKLKNVFLKVYSLHKMKVKENLEVFYTTIFTNTNEKINTNTCFKT